MSYRVKEIFYTLQGEGANAGRPAVFVRLAGCNLWNGLESGRDSGRGGCAKWCDTDFVGGETMDAGTLATRMADVGGNCRFAVVTGGEPLLQLDDALIASMKRLGFEIAVETNGTIPPPPGIDWLTVSPKANAELVARTGDEIKLVYPQNGIDPADYTGLTFRRFYLQPRDGWLGSTEACIAYCLKHPQWRLSLQTHKLIGLP
jgi:7-carboxy-7-deazaguanine synthase